MVFFSVIIPVYNRENLIRETINSVLKQSFYDFEIIVVDDGSTDKTLSALKEYGNRVKVLSQQNQGPGAARNIGIQIAQGKYITFLDSDDLWFPWTLATFYETIRKENFPTFIAGSTIEFEEEIELQKVQPDLVKYTFFQDYLESYSQSFNLLPSNVAIRVDSLLESGCFTNRWINAEDCDLWLKLGAAQGFVAIQDPPVLAYRRHENTAISDISRSIQGMNYLVQQELAGNYPGDQARKRERLEILTRHIRPVSFECLKQKCWKDGWELYWASLKWHIYLRRVRYLIAFPVIAMASKIASL
jgi:glycosyltransferase involved in cell wall biosynthesis